MWLSAFGAWIAFLSIVKCQTHSVRCTNHLTQVTLEVSPLLLTSICADNSPTQILISSDTGFRIDDVYGFCTSFDLNIGTVKMDYDVTSTSLTLQLLKNGETLDAARMATVEAENEGSDLVSVWGHRNTRLVLKIVRTCYIDANSPSATTTASTHGQTVSVTEESTPKTPTRLTTSTTTLTSIPGPNNPRTPKLDRLTTNPIRSQQTEDMCEDCSTSNKGDNYRLPVNDNTDYNRHKDDNTNDIINDVANNVANDYLLHKTKTKTKPQLPTTTPSSRVLAKLRWMEEKRISFEKKMKMLREYVPEDDHRNPTSPGALDNNYKNTKSIQTTTTTTSPSNQAIQRNIDVRLSSNSAGSRVPTEHKGSIKNVSLENQNESVREQLTTSTVPTTIVNKFAYRDNQIKQAKSENTIKSTLLSISSIAPVIKSEEYQQWLPRRGIIPSPSGINGHTITSKEPHLLAFHGKDTTLSHDSFYRQSYDVSLNTPNTDTNTKSINLFSSSYPNYGEDPTIPSLIATESTFLIWETSSEYLSIMPTPVVSFPATYDDTRSSRSTILSKQYNSITNIRTLRVPDFNKSSPLIGPAAFFPLYEIKPTSMVFQDDSGNAITSKEDNSSSFSGKDLKNSEILVSPTEIFTATTKNTWSSKSKSAISLKSLSSSFGHYVTSKLMSTSHNNHLTITQAVQSSSIRWNSPASGNNKNRNNPVYSPDNKIFTSADSSLHTLSDTLISSMDTVSSPDFYSSTLWQSSDESATSVMIHPLPSTPPLVSLQTAPTPVDFSTPLNEQLSIKVSKTEELFTTSYVISENVENSTIPLREKEEALDGETFWPVVAALVVGIPSVIVFGIAIVVIHRRRQPLTRKPFGMRPLSSSSPSSVPDDMNRVETRRSVV